MDVTQSLENESLRGDMSYLYGRDPSILAYGQRPFPSQNSKKNLISLLEEEKQEESIPNKEKVYDSSNIQTIKVFLRMKPFPSKIKLTTEQSQAYCILNSTTLLTKMPSLDNNTSCLKKIKVNEVISRKYTFTQTFGPDTSQLELFEQAVKPQMISFLAGKNSVVMTYGTTNSGKTFTLQGTAQSPGIIPRGIEFVFSNVNPKAVPMFKPVNLNDVIYLNKCDYLQEMEMKNKLFSFNHVDKSFSISTYKQMQQLLHKESSIESKDNYAGYYSVWISFAEIYNETIHDLLWNDCQKKRPALKLAVDSKGRAFVKGLKSIFVNSGSEAYQVLMAGQYNLKVAATALNSKSSRSHCIFTIKLLKYKTEHNPESVEVSTFSFCDLAGSERLKKTLNVGERLKEAQNINTSLLVLGRCLKTIYEIQSSSKQKNESIGPFRESKLTRLFQKALSGKEQIGLIVNVNPLPNLYVETQNVLNFSAIAKKIIIEHSDIVKRRYSNSRFSRLVTQSMKTDMDWEDTELNDMIEETTNYISENDQEDYEDLITENGMLKNEIKELKAAAFTRDMQTRQEMTNMYSEIMKKLETDWKNRMTDLEEQQEDLRDLAIERIELFYKEKLSQLSFRKRSLPILKDEIGDDDQTFSKDLEAENTRLVSTIETMKKYERDLKQKKEKLEGEKIRILLDLTIAKEEVKRVNEMLLAAQESINFGDDASKNYVESLNAIIKSKDDRIKRMKEFLNEAKEEYIFITNQTQQMENQVKLKDALLTENLEQIHDLKDQINEANAYSAEQSKIIEALEDELEQQTKKLQEAETELIRLSKLFESSASSCNIDFTSENRHRQYFKDFEKNELIENCHLREKLNKIVNEILLLQNKLDKTENQLPKVTEKADHLTIENNEIISNHLNNHVSMKQENQFEIINALVKDLPQIFSNYVNISCQTSKFYSPSIKTDEKYLQTVIFDSPHKQKSVVEKFINTETLNVKEIDEQQKQNKEISAVFEKASKELQNKINELNIDNEEKNERINSLQTELKELFKSSEEEKFNLNCQIEAQYVKEKNIQDQYTKALACEQEKDNEIRSLQKELKNLIQCNEETIRKMEIEIKTILKELTLTKHKLVKEEEKSIKLDNDYKQVIHILETKIGTLEQQVFEKQIENQKLKTKIEELEKSLCDTEHELEVFTTHRKETVSKYEDLVKCQYEDLELTRKEVTKLQEILQERKENTLTPSKESKKKVQCNLQKHKKKDETHNASEECYSEDNNQAEKLKLKKDFITPPKSHLTLNLSGCESKSAKSENKDSSISTKRTRKKRLFNPFEESFIDIDQNEPSQPCRSIIRNLRNRRK